MTFHMIIVNSDILIMISLSTAQQATLDVHVNSDVYFHDAFYQWCSCFVSTSQGIPSGLPESKCLCISSLKTTVTLLPCELHSLLPDHVSAYPQTAATYPFAQVNLIARDCCAQVQKYDHRVHFFISLSKCLTIFLEWGTMFPSLANIFSSLT